ncbi:DUF2254 domain-containing protein [Tautonia rosea]|uniref:DUF2254 domain-containing protein n=1 Tax=Tautonia rosea TaxID=2728037 RepID=UPI0014739D99|nr:DUF2254 domain-containing protein [Tautonia rosea]
MKTPSNLLSSLWNSLRTSLWFVPSLIVLSMIVLAIVLVYGIGTLGESFVDRFPKTFGAGADGARGLLTAVASSMITVAGVTFSITIVVLSQTASQYSPRILPNFMRDRFNQAVLGTFVGIFAYCLVVVRTIRGGEDEFVPSLAVLVSVVLALIGVGVLIAFIHHIIASIQSGQIIADAAQETLHAIDHLFPEPLGEPLPEDRDPAIPRFLGSTAWLPIPARSSGYLCRVDSKPLMELAERLKAVIRMEYAPGDFCVVGMPLVSIASGPATGHPKGDVENRQAILDMVEGEDQDDEAKLRQIARELDALYSFGRNRTVGQDVGFGIQQLVDIALKALSPGVNETTTAVTCIHHLTLINSRLASRKIETRQRAKDGCLRVIAQKPTFESMLSLSFEEIRRNAAGNVSILEELFVAMKTIGVFARDNDRRRTVLAHVIAIAELADQSVSAPSDRAGMEPRIRQVLESLGDPNAGSWTMGDGPSNDGAS